MHGCNFLAVRIHHSFHHSIYMHLYNPKASSALKAKDLSKLSSMDTTMLALIFSVAFFLIQGAHSMYFSFINRCPFTVWPATLQGEGSPPFSPAAFSLSRGERAAIAAPDGWSGRIWARHQCSIDKSGKFSCLSGDCGTGQLGCNGARGATPATLVEITLNGYDGQDYYDVSLVEGFNVPVSVTSQGGSGTCGSAGCPVNINARCPPELWASTSAENVFGCKSACLAFNKDEDCCRGAYGSPTTCKPSHYAAMFKNLCPQAYSYAYDGNNTFSCYKATGYLITFCP